MSFIYLNISDNIIGLIGGATSTCT